MIIIVKSKIVNLPGVKNESGRLKNIHRSSFVVDNNTLSTIFRIKTSL